MVPFAAARNLQRTVHALQWIINGDDTAVSPFLFLVTLTFKLVQARDHARPPCEFGANLRYLSLTNKTKNKKVTRQC